MLSFSTRWTHIQTSLKPTYILLKRIEIINVKLAFHLLSFTRSSSIDFRSGYTSAIIVLLLNRTLLGHSYFLFLLSSVLPPFLFSLPKRENGSGAKSEIRSSLVPFPSVVFLSHCCITEPYSRAQIGSLSVELNYSLTLASYHKVVPVLWVWKNARFFLSKKEIGPDTYVLASTWLIQFSSFYSWITRTGWMSDI